MLRLLSVVVVMLLPGFLAPAIALAQNNDNQPQSAPQPPDAVTTLREQLAGDAPDARAEAARKLGQLAEKADAAVPDLVARLADDSAAVRSLAAEALGKIATRSELAVPALIKLLTTDTTDWVRRRAATTLGSFG
ncbi:MAG: HEAT repeat domain-containing protein, partial [Planctomycetota bacterium]